MKIVSVVGARPNFMKVAPPPVPPNFGGPGGREMAKYPQEFEQILVHTGQHYDDNMSKVFFEDLELPQPDIYLGVGSGSHAQQTARIMRALWNRPLLQSLSWNMTYSTGLALEPVQ